MNPIPINPIKKETARIILEKARLLKKNVIATSVKKLKTIAFKLPTIESLFSSIMP